MKIIVNGREINKKAFGERLQQIISEKKIDNREIENALHIRSGITVVKWISGETCPTYRHIKKLSDFFGMSIEDMLQGTYME